MHVNIKTIPHKQHRYPTVGDWYTDGNGVQQIRVSEMTDGRYERLVAIHELIEQVLCDCAGVDEADVTAFDVAFERNRLYNDQSEPGDDVKAPYHRQHQIATAIEMLLATEMGVDWEAYHKEVNGLE